MILAGFMAAAGGCAQVGDFQRPPPQIPGNWPKSAPSHGSLQASQTEWRTFFRDPRLQALITAAFSHNRDLRIALARLSEARAQYGIVQADRLPSTNLTLNQSAAKFPAELAGSGNPIVSRRAELSVTAVSFELDFWGRVANLSEAAHANFLASQETRRALRISLIAEVANQYFTILELDERTSVARALIATREKSLAIIRRGMELGAAARSEVLLAEAALSTSQSELAILEHQRSNAEQTLMLLTGLQLGQLPTGFTLNAQDVRSDLAPGIPSDVLFLRPDVLAAEHRLKETRANIAAARAAFLPRILLTASLGLASRSLAGLFGAGSGNWSYQPTITQPLFDWGRTSGQFDLATARQDNAVAEYEKTIQQAFREVADLLAARTSLATQRQAAEAAAKAHAERLIVAEARFKGGSASYLEVLDVQREAFNAQQTLTLIRRAQLNTAAQLYKALGGGIIGDES